MTKDAPREENADFDSSLVERARSGEAEAVDELLGRYLPGLRGYISKNVGIVVQAKESSSDLVQSVCREVLEHLERFQYDGEEGFRRWLYATASRKIKDRHRFYHAGKRDAGREIPIERGESSASGQARKLELYESMTSPSENADRKEQLAKMDQVLQELPDKYRVIIQEIYLLRNTHAEVAQRLGVSEAHSRVLLSRAMARLGRLLEETEL